MREFYVNTMLAGIIMIVAVCPFLAWRISEFDENEDYYKRRKYVRLYIILIIIFFVFWEELMRWL